MHAEKGLQRLSAEKNSLQPDAKSCVHDETTVQTLCAGQNTTCRRSLQTSQALCVNPETIKNTICFNIFAYCRPSLPNMTQNVRNAVRKQKLVRNACADPQTLQRVSAKNQTRSDYLNAVQAGAGEDPRL